MPYCELSKTGVTCQIKNIKWLIKDGGGVCGKGDICNSLNNKRLKKEKKKRVVSWSKYQTMKIW